MSSWRDMAEAPRDGSRIIGWFGDRAIVVFWRSGPEWIKHRGYGRRVAGSTIWYWSDGYSRYREPDCWQPQPATPKQKRFPVKEPPPSRNHAQPVFKSPAARRKIIAEKSRPIIVEKPKHLIEDTKTDWAWRLRLAAEDAQREANRNAPRIERRPPEAVPHEVTQAILREVRESRA